MLQCDVTKTDHFPTRVKPIFLKLLGHELWVETSFDGLILFNGKQPGQDRKSKLFEILNSFLL